MGTVTGRFHIICTASAKQLVNDTLRNIESDGGDPIRVALRLANSPNSLTSNGVAFGGSWATEDSTRQAINAALRDAGWSPKPSNAERTVYTASSTPPSFSSGQRVWIFEGDGVDSVSFDQALAMLGLKRPYDPGPGGI